MEENSDDLPRLFLGIMTHICKTPGAHTWHNSFAEVVASIDGAAYALCQLYSDLEDPLAMLGFREWLVKRYARQCNGMRNLWWWGYIRRSFADEAEAISQMPILFAQYLDQRSRPRRQGLWTRSKAPV